MNAVARRFAAGFVMAAAPAIIAVGGATAAHATATTATNTGPTTSQGPAAHQGQGAQDGVTSLARRHHRHHGYYHRSR